MKSKLLLTCFSLIILFSACQENERKALIIGNWQGVDWTLDGVSSERNAQAVFFTFEEGGTYQANFGQDKESGSYRIVSDKLYTTETDKLEKMVQLPMLNADSLIMDMNRVGQAEQLILVRKN